MSRPRITYFDCRGRVEPIRLLLEGLGIQFDDHRVPAEEWLEVKPKTPFGGLPSFVDGDLEIWQTHAVLRHLARTHDLYGSTETDHVQCDIFEEAFADLNALLGRAPWRPDFEAGRPSFIRLELGPALAQLERQLQQAKGCPSTWVGSSLTFVDFVAFGVLDHAWAMFPEVSGGYPLLQEFCAKFARRSRIAAYLQSDRRPAALQFGPKGQIFELAD